MGIPAAVGLIPVGGHFHSVAFHPEDHNSEILSQFADHRDPGVFRRADDLFRPGIGHHIIVVGGPAQEHVPDGTPHHMGLEAPGLEHIHDGFHISRNRQFHCRSPSLPVPSGSAVSRVNTPTSREGSLASFRLQWNSCSMSRSPCCRSQL